MGVRWARGSTGVSTRNLPFLMVSVAPGGMMKTRLGAASTLSWACSTGISVHLASSSGRALV
jgi:hypothetical protein